MKTQLITIKSRDDFELDGAFYTTDEVRQEGISRRVVSILHGKTMNFYVGLARLLPRALTQIGYDCLSLNRRGHDLGSIRNSLIPQGDAWTNYRQHLEDVDAGVKYLENLGYNEILLVGQSLGSNLACTYALSNQIIRRLILTSPLPAYSLTTIPIFLPESEREKVIRDARKISRKGKRRVYSLSGWPFLIDSETLLSNLKSEKELPNLLDCLQNLDIPVLIIYGSDPLDLELGAPIFKKKDELEKKEIKVVQLQGSDHFFNGFEKEIESVITDWLIKTEQE